MTAHPAPSARRGHHGAPHVPDAPPFPSALVRTVFAEVTPLHLARPAARAAAAVARTVLTEIIDGAREAAVAESRAKLVPRDFVSAIGRDISLEVGAEWYLWTPTFRDLLGVMHDADGSVITPRMRRGSGKPTGVDGAHRFEAGIRRLLRSRGARAVPAMVRDLDGVTSVFLTDLARSAATVVREGGITRFGAVSLGAPAGPPPVGGAAARALATRTYNRRTIGCQDILVVTTLHPLPRTHQ
ncbi:hypothetical protein [Streptomyces sp. SPB074]|uniref:hypothetical protein n=1 Tax=Streptomyces sp. (strain SPB074) TaxID=465543 RepID=UPI0001D1E344|nr:hypothetical protein [Streptomyces sp. SPB074]EDY42798.2 conserved hypothetical protein [Streptomyces sp. SPB074]